MRSPGIDNVELLLVEITKGNQSNQLCCPVGLLFDEENRAVILYSTMLNMLGISSQ